MNQQITETKQKLIECCLFVGPIDRLQVFLSPESLKNLRDALRNYMGYPWVIDNSNHCFDYRKEEKE